MNETLKNKTDSTREYSRQIVLSIQGLSKKLEASRRTPIDDVADFLKDLNAALLKLTEVAEKEVSNGTDGVSVIDAKIKGKNLILTLSNGKSVDVGRVIGEDGLDGEDADESKIYKKLLAAIPKPKELDENAFLQKVIAKMPKEKQVSTEEVIKKIKENKALSYQDLADLPDIVSMIRQHTRHIEGLASRFRPVAGTNVISKMLDVDGAIAPTNGQVLVWNATKGKYVPQTFSGGAGFTKLETADVPDDTIVDFHFDEEPLYLVINGSWYDNNGGAYTWTWNGTDTATLNEKIQTGGTIWGFR